MKRAILVFTVIFFSLAIFAQTPVKQRQISQQKRINLGVQSGELTRKEVVQLEKQQRSVVRTKRVAAADGVITSKERAIIHHKQQNASRAIAAKKHNDRNR